MTSLAIAAVMVTVDGQRYREPERLRSVRVASRLSRPAQCELVIAAPHGASRWPPDWSFGAPVTVAVADQDGVLFDGEVTCLELVHGPEGATQVRIRAYDRLHRLRKRQRLRVFEEVTPADLVARLVADLGVELVAEESGPRLDRVVQAGQSDFDLLLEVTAAAGLHAVLRGRQLRLLTLAGYGDPVPLRFGTSLWEVRAEANLDRVARRVTALGWHSQRAEPLTQVATAARGRPRTGPGPDPGLAGADAQRYLVDQPGRSDDQLLGLAQAALDRSGSHAVTVRGVAEGDGRLWAGGRIELEQLADELTGCYLVTEAVHTVDAHGYQTAFSTGLADRGHTDPAGAAITLGRVTAVDDPDGLARVRVALPAYGDLDVGWLAVLCPGAGAGRGVVVLPDVGDTVAVALPRRSPAEGIVLGPLFGTAPPPDSGVEGDRVRRWTMHTAAGQKVVLDDAGELLRVENQGGSYLQLGPDRLVLHAETDLVIEAPGQAVTVRANTVDFERAVL
jgi:uncharacterized protein involved in type VI secretion and phage assembly